MWSILSSKHHSEETRQTTFLYFQIKGKLMAIQALKMDPDGWRICIFKNKVAGDIREGRHKICHLVALFILALFWRDSPQAVNGTLQLVTAFDMEVCFCIKDSETWACCHLGKDTVPETKRSFSKNNKILESRAEYQDWVMGEQIEMNNCRHEIYGKKAKNEADSVQRDTLYICT